MASTEQPTKKQRTLPTYELLYHPVIPGRAEFIRLALEAAGAPYVDVSNTDAQHSGYARVQASCVGEAASTGEGNAPAFAPPALRVVAGGAGTGAGGDDEDNEALILAQTANVLRYLGAELDLEGGDDDDGDARTKWWVGQVALTALDLNDEIHDTHHPIASGLYYEDQKPEARRKADDVRRTRIPKYLAYFARTLEWNRGKGGEGKYLVSKRLTYADTTVWQVLDGLMFAFPKEMAARKEEFPDLLGSFYEGIREQPRLKEYLASERRLPYSQGVFRYYPELDRQ